MAAINGLPITPQSVVDRFNQLVSANIEQRGNAVWHDGNLPHKVTGRMFGERAEHSMRASDFDEVTRDQGQPAYIARLAFYVLHQFAQKMTRVRNTRILLDIHFYANAASPPVDRTFHDYGIRLAALRENLGVTFGMPSSMPALGSVITTTELDNFLRSLRDKINEVRRDSDFTMTVLACHSNCHSNCHGSRGRR